MPERLTARFGKPASSMNAPEAAVDRILAALSAGELKAGDKLPDEVELAQHFGVARMALRTALGVLRDLGLVNTTRGRFGGTFVSTEIRERLRSMALEPSFSAGELRGLSDWRRAISGEACHLAALRATDAQLAELAALAQDFVDDILDTDARRLADARLHVLIAETTGSRHLIEQERAIQEAFGRIYDSLPIVRHPLNIASMDHAPLLQALRARDGERARAAMLAHVESTYAWCCSLLRVQRLD
ncbi:FadR/GntR family transcriptional regulator [Burkholderia gladioli]|uniref:FadR/GntR family transcriptional regulator n=1 Tax=Burkholderia gladioli TaxID=28095 RepID=UPI00163F7693|nr:FCD domain-containing protein [Burkholderia gladioli]